MKNLNLIDDIEIIELSTVTPEYLRERLKEHTLDQMFSNVFNHKDELKKVYPNIEEWINKKVKPSFNRKDGSREIILALKPENDVMRILGFMILKNTNEEKKICTIRVNKSFRKQGVGSKLFEKAIDFLGNDKDIVITISENYIENFEKILKKYDFKIDQIIDGMYVKNLKEYIFIREGN